MSKRISAVNRIGQKFNRLTILSVFIKNKHSVATVVCECGNKKEILVASLVSGNTKSCGCFSDELKSQFGGYKTHGLSYHPLHAIWDGIKARCLNPNRNCYPYYGGNGVKICEEWKNDFMAFYNWSIANGWKKGLQIDKDIKGNGLLYSPETCCWVTRKKNANKTRSNHYVLYDGETMSLSEFAEKIKMNYKTVSTRIHRGWDIDMIVSAPVRNRAKLSANPAIQ